MMEGSKRLNSEKKEDYISALPDAIIHHILSFLPLTKMAIQTGVLSKRWHKQWTHVPVLVFDSTHMSHEKFSRSIDNTIALHECLKIKKFHIRSEVYNREEDPYPHFDEKVRFALSRDVQELILEFIYFNEEFELPKFLFNHAHLVKLQTDNCAYLRMGKVNWRSLKKLGINSCSLSDGKVQNVLYGSPVLESLELNECFGLDNLVIASESLEVLLLVNLEINDAEISCPNLVQLSIESTGVSDENIQHVINSSVVLESFKLEGVGSDWLENLVITSKSLKVLALVNLEIVSIKISCPNLVELSVELIIISDGAIEHVLSQSRLLQSLKLLYCQGFRKLVIASESLKRLVVESCQDFEQVVITSNSLERLVLLRLNISSGLGISSSGLGELKVSNPLHVYTLKLKNSTSIIRATLDLRTRSEESAEDLVKEILEQLQHVEELKFGGDFIKMLSASEEGGSTPPLVNNRCLILAAADFEKHAAGIAFALRSSPVLEKLVIKMSLDEIYLNNQESDRLWELNDMEDNYWISKETAFSCIVSHLKTIEIINLSEKDSKCMYLINFLRFLLKSARVLEIMNIIVDGATDFATIVFEKLLSFPKCSGHAVIRLSCLPTFKVSW